MKIIYMADLHGIEGLYSQLFRLAVNWRADAIIIGGDLLPKHGSFWTSVEDQRDFIIRFMKPRLEEIHDKLPGLEVYAMMGNDDWLINIPLLEELQSRRLLKLLHNKKYRLGNGFELIGYGNVPPTPFSFHPPRIWIRTVPARYAFPQTKKDSTAWLIKFPVN